MWFVSIFSLGVVVLLCAIGATHERYADNLWQRVGMGFIGIGYGSLLAQAPIDTQPLAHLGLALFGLGTAWKVWKHSRPQKPPQPPVASTHDPWWRVKG